MLAALVAVAAVHAESAGTLPAGSQVVYGGAGATTCSNLRWGAGDSVGDMDRMLRSRIDLYYARGLAQRLTLAAYAPLLRSQGLDTMDGGACPSDFCETVTTVGAAAVQGRFRAVSDPLQATLALGVTGDPWNAGTRERYTSVGDATIDLVPALYLGRDFSGGSFGLVGWGAYGLRFGRTVDLGSIAPFEAPADDVRGAVEVHVRPADRIQIELGANGFHRLWGLDWELDYYDVYWPTADRWAVLYTGVVNAAAKVSVDLGHGRGLHVSASRTVWVRNGPPDAMDFGIGLHQYFAPK